MALAPQLEALMIHRIVVEHISASTGGDGYNKRIYNPASTFRARIEFVEKLVKDSTSRSVVSTTRMFTPMWDVNRTPAVIGLSDRVTLPVQFEPNQPPILSVQPHYDHEGPHHFEVYL